MDFEKFERDLKSKYKRSRAGSIDKKVASLLSHIESEWGIPAEKMTMHELKTIAMAVLETETSTLHDEVEELLAQKERIERQLERKSDELQHAKYNVFNAIESGFAEDAMHARANLIQVKLQSIDLFDILSEMVESAIITTLEKNHDIEETIEEITKEIAYETLSEGTLNTIRIRKIITTMLQTAVDIAEASPNHAHAILRSSLRGIRSGLIRSINRFKQQLIYMPDEAKLLLIENFEQLQEELSQVDSLFSQTVVSLANQSNPSTKKLLTEISEEIRYDMEELVHISKETVEVMRDRFSHLAKEAVERSARVLNSKTAMEAKRMGIQMWGTAKKTLDDAIKSARDAIDKR